MTKAEIFKKAHKLAKSFTGDYRACFSLALRAVLKLANLTKMGVDSVKEWASYGKSRVYFGLKTETSKGIKYVNWFMDRETKTFGNDLISYVKGTLPVNVREFIQSNY